MTLRRLSPLRLLPILIFGLSVQRLPSAQLLNDRDITVRSAREVAAKRQALVKYLWGPEGFPKRRLPDSVVTNVAIPVKQLTNLARVDELRMELAPGLEGLAYHFIPQHPNRELV